MAEAITIMAEVLDKKSVGDVNRIKASNNTVQGILFQLKEIVLRLLTFYKGLLST
jgi:hypothetical protein